ncbi:MAG: nicotinate-nucleotide adenylyltransferase [Acidimicrobiales bacterium]
MVRSGPARRIGIFGGTFDPPHIGHLVAAIDARDALDLDVVLLVVANVPWQKVGARAISPADARLAMVRAVDDAPGLEVSDLEVRRGGDSYTADTLAELRAAEPDAELFVILGEDAAAGITTWERYEEVAAAPGWWWSTGPACRELDARFDWVHVDIPELEVSSTELRERAAEGRSIRYLTPAGVAPVIGERGLYR